MYWVDKLNLEIPVLAITYLWGDCLPTKKAEILRKGKKSQKQLPAKRRQLERKINFAVYYVRFTRV